MGLGHEGVMAQRPGLVYALVTGYGIEGEDADRRAYDIAAYWARSASRTR